ncbi:MAG: acyl-homoserine-lactone synthase [Roseovarius sp.]
MGSARSSRGKPIELAGTQNIQTVEMSFKTMHQFGDLWVRYMEARKAIFIDRLHWDVSEADGMEFDQYDTPHCRWVALVEFGEVVGGVRLMPTTANCGVYSYMLRDAQRGMLPGIPSDVLFVKAPVNPRIWEATRFFIADGVSARRRLALQGHLFKAMHRIAREHGAEYLLGIVPSVWARWARRIGVSATPIGAIFGPEDARVQSVIFNTAKR